MACGSEMLNIKQIAAVEKRVDELKKKALLPKVLKSIRVDPKYLFRVSFSTSELTCVPLGINCGMVSSALSKDV